MTPLCASSTSAAAGSRSTSGGKRASASYGGLGRALLYTLLSRTRTVPGTAFARSSSPRNGTRHASTCNAPHPWSLRLSARHPSRGFRARTIGSCAGFNAVFHPSHRFASSLVASVTSHSRGASPPFVALTPNPPPDRQPVPRVVYVPVTRRSTPNRSSTRRAASEPCGMPLP